MMFYTLAPFRYIFRELGRLTGMRFVEASGVVEVYIVGGLD